MSVRNVVRIGITNIDLSRKLSVILMDVRKVIWDYSESLPNSGMTSNLIANGHKKSRYKPMVVIELNFGFQLSFLLLSLIKLLWDQLSL